MPAQPDARTRFRVGLVRVLARTGLTRLEVARYLAGREAWRKARTVQEVGRRPPGPSRRSRETGRPTPARVHSWRTRLDAWSDGTALPSHWDALRAVLLDVLDLVDDTASLPAADPARDLIAWHTLLEAARAEPAAARRDRRATAAVPAAVPASPDSPAQVRLGVPPLLAPAFQPRENLTASIDSALRRTGRTVVLVGDGGRGKTQLARAAFSRWSPRCPISMWVTAGSRDAVLAAYVDAVHAVPSAVLGAGRPDAATGTDGEHLALRWLEWLASTDQPWLVVLDDVADPAHLAGLWPSGETGRVVVSTRRRDDAMIGQDRAVVDVGEFSAAESLTYLSARLPGTARAAGWEQDASALAGELGCLPLALDQAAAYMADQAVGFAEYRRLCADRSRRLADVLPHSPGGTYARAVSAAWSLAADAADRLPPAGIARPMLELISLLDPNGIPEHVLLTPSARGYLDRRHGWPDATEVRGVRPTTPSNARAALRNLHRLSLIAHDPSDAYRTVRMHALAQRAARETMTGEEVGEAARAAGHALAEGWRPPRTDLFMGQALTTNGTTLEQFADAMWDVDEGVPEYLFRICQSLGDLGLLVSSGERISELRRSAADRLAPDHPAHLTVMHLHAFWLGWTGDARGAAAELSSMAARQARVLGVQHPDTLTSQDALSTWQGRSGRVREAVSSLEALVEVMTAAVGAEDPWTLDCRGRLAHWKSRAGDDLGALNAFEALRADRARVLGPDDVNTVLTELSVGGARGRCGDPDAAISLLSDGLHRCARDFGEHHPVTLAWHDCLATWYARVGAFAAAVDHTSVTVAGWHAVFGPNHPHALAAAANSITYATFLEGPGSGVDRGRDLLDRQLVGLGARHPHLLAVRRNVALWTGLASEPGAAVAALVTLMADIGAALGPDHPQTLGCRQALAGWRMRQGELSVGMEELEQVLSDAAEVLGTAHMETRALTRSLQMWTADPIRAAADPSAAETDPILIGTSPRLAAWSDTERLHLIRSTGPASSTAPVPRPVCARDQRPAPVMPDNV